MSRTLRKWTGFVGAMYTNYCQMALCCFIFPSVIVKFYLTTNNACKVFLRLHVQYLKITMNSKWSYIYTCICMNPPWHREITIFLSQISTWILFFKALEQRGAKNGLIWKQQFWLIDDSNASERIVESSFNELWVNIFCTDNIHLYQQLKYLQITVWHSDDLNAALKSVVESRVLESEVIFCCFRWITI